MSSLIRTQQFPFLTGRARRRLASALATVAVAAVMPWAASAEGRGGGKGAPGAEQGGDREQRRAEMRARFEKRFGQMLREEVGLPDARAQQVEAVFRTQREAAKALHQQLREHRKALAALLREDSDDQAAYAKALDGMTKTHRALHDLRQQGIDKARKLLQPKEQAKLLRAMHKARRHMMEKGHRRGPQGPGGPDGDHAGHPGSDHGPDHDDDFGDDGPDA